MTLYLPTDDELAEGIGPWDFHDTANAATKDELAGGTLAAFEEDRYARLLQEHGSAPYSVLSGSIGSTNVSRGAW